MDWHIVYPLTKTSLWGSDSWVDPSLFFNKWAIKFITKDQYGDTDKKDEHDDVYL
jgi:hypothetical protein